MPHALRVMLRSARLPRILRTAHTHQDYAFLFFFVASLCGLTYFYTRMTNQSLIDSLNAELQSAHAEVLAIREAGIFGKARLAACKRVIVALEALNAAQKASK